MLARAQAAHIIKVIPTMDVDTGVFLLHHDLAFFGKARGVWLNELKGRTLPTIR